MPWQDILTLLNTIDTAAGVLFLIATWFGFRAWWRNRHAQTGQSTVEPPRPEDPQKDAGAR